MSVETPLYNEGMRDLVEPRKVHEAQRAWAENTLAARASEMRGAGVAAHAVVRSGVAVTALAAFLATKR